MQFFDQSLIWPLDSYCVDTKIAAFHERFKKPHLERFWDNLLLGDPFPTIYVMFVSPDTSDVSPLKNMHMYVIDFNLQISS